MGWWSRLFGGEAASPEAFAQEFLRALKRVGDERTYRYDAEHFSLVEEGGKEGALINLHNFHAEYLRAPARAREAVLEHFARAMRQEAPPMDWPSVQHNLRPQVTNRSRFALGALQAKAQGLPFPLGELLPLTEDLVLSLVVDLPQLMATAPWAQCEAWGVTREQALSVAVENLARVSREDFQRQGALFVSPWHDNYDAARLTLIEKLARLSVKGELVALVPHRDHLLLTGSEDEAGLAQLLEAVEKHGRATRFMGFYPVVLREGKWRAFHLPEQHPLAERFRYLEVGQRMQLYEEQKQLLGEVYDKEEVDLFIATFTGFRAQGHILSRTVWTKGVSTLLPRADRVVLMEEASVTARPLDVPWEVLWRHAGPLLVRDESLYPERYLAREFPSDEVLAALRREIHPLAH